MSISNYQKLYKELNIQQKKAVDSVEGTTIVIAGPGTGKTQILTMRIANILLQTQINPENILACNIFRFWCAFYEEKITRNYWYTGI